MDVHIQHIKRNSVWSKVFNKSVMNIEVNAKCKKQRSVATAMKMSCLCMVNACGALRSHT